MTALPPPSYNVKKKYVFADLILGLRKSFGGQKVNILLFFTEQYPSIHKLFFFILNRVSLK